jgi:hypothetical protein
MHSATEAVEIKRGTGSSGFMISRMPIPWIVCMCAKLILKAVCVVTGRM